MFFTLPKEEESHLFVPNFQQCVETAYSKLKQLNIPFLFKANDGNNFCRT